MPKFDVSFEGKEKTIEGNTAEEINDKVTEFAHENGLENWFVKNEKNDKLSKKDVMEAKKLRLMRNETAGCAGFYSQ